MKQFFNDFTTKAATILGKAWVFCIAFGLIIAWVIGGFFFGFGDTYQLIVNTTTTIVTFLMVFVVQNTQERGNYALQLKLDEIIRSIKKADNKLISIEDLSLEDLEKLVKKKHKQTKSHK